MKTSPIRILWLILGFTCATLGTLGIVLPFLPTVPFYMATVFCFSKSSKKLHDKFVSTKLYKKYLESFMRDRAMTMGNKIKVVIMVTIVMGIGFYFMKMPVARIVMGVVWGFHLYYFFGRIKTITVNKKSDNVSMEDNIVSENTSKKDKAE